MNNSSLDSDPQVKLTAVEFDPFASGELLLTAPATAAQREIWFSTQMGDEANCAFNESLGLWLRGPLNVEALRTAFQEVVQRHEALRTTLSPDGSVLCIAPSLALEIPLIDLSTASNREAELAAICQQEAQQPFHLELGPLFRAKIIKVQPQEHLALITAHHIICDGWSWGVFLPDLAAFYSAIEQGQSPSLPEPERFSQYALLQQQLAESPEVIAAEQFWLAQFADEVPVLNLPLDRPRPPMRSYHSAREDWEINPTLVADLKRIGAKLGCSFLNTLLAGWEIFLSRISGQTDLVVGIPTAGQPIADLEQLVGHCVNLLPLRTRIDREQPFSDYLRQRRSALLDAYDHQQLTFGSLLNQLTLPRDASRIPLVSVIFNLEQNFQSEQFQFAELEVEFFSNPRIAENFELFINAVESKGHLVLECQYNTDLFEVATIRRRLEEFEVLLAGIAADPTQPIWQLPILSVAEQTQILVDWNQTSREYRHDRCLHELFVTQVERTPDAVAVVSGNQSLTYQELNTQANQLAHYLQSLGVGPEVLVGICVERSLSMLVGLLGILKAGGTYLPLDPAYPQERLEFMLADAQVSVLLTQETLLTKLPQVQTRCVCLDRDWPAVAAHPPINPASNSSPTNLAYVLYTSGSTGRPKGVAIAHRSTVAFVEWALSAFSPQQLTGVLASTSICFDLSIFELFVPLSCGGKTILAENALQLPSLPAATEVTLINTVPSAAAELIRLGLPNSIKTVNLAGEPLPQQLVRLLYERGHIEQVFNLYGPSEATTYSTFALAETNTNQPPIGRPIANTQVYILDSHLQPVPIGVAGELHIGGAGLAIGYLNRPELTAEKFIANPWSDRPGDRLYKTGDLARYLPNGQIEYLGRLDNQVKVRGFRIELGEIEATLQQHPAVRDGVVVARAGVAGDKVLVAYLVPEDLGAIANQETGSDASRDQMADWQQTWDVLYQSGFENLSKQKSPDGKSLDWQFDNVPLVFLGLSSTLQENQSPDLQLDDVALSGQVSEMETMETQVKEWVDQTIERILSLKPNRVMEIGCGSGQVLFRVAPHCSYFLGTDYIPSAIQELEKKVKASESNLTQVALDCRAADCFEGLEPASFDTVIINSVVQYFPDSEYLERVVENSIQTLKPGGCLYVGDVQSYGLLTVYHVSELLKRSPLSMPLEEFRAALTSRVAHEQELTIDPGFFYALEQRLPAIGRVEIQLRRGSILNEVTRFHYDVFLYVEPESQTVVNPTWHDWQEENLTLASLQQLLETTQPDLYCIKQVPNARLQKEVKAHELLKSSSLVTVEDLLKALEEVPAGVEPEQVWALAETLPYHVEIRWSDLSSKAGNFEVILIRKTSEPSPILKITPPLETTASNVSGTRYANTPALQKASNYLVPELRSFLKAKLPDYMIPTTFVFLEAMPLTPNGKIDRRALPNPAQNRLELAPNYLAPRTPIESTIAEIWAEVLQLERVGVNDNFFEVGGHSLLAIRVLLGLQEAFGIELALKTLFQSPTVAALAQQVEAWRYLKAGETIEFSEDQEREEFEL